MTDSKKLISIFNDTSRKFPKADEIAAISIRKAITTGALPPGELIDEMEIAGYMNLSRMPVRQAMIVLESEGLVKRVYKKGVFVTELSKAELEEIYHIRARLEGLAISKAVPKLTKKSLYKSQILLNELTDPNLNIENFIEINADFHMSLYSASEWFNLLWKITELRNNASRYIAISHNFKTSDSIYLDQSDHKLILQACEEQDAEKAEKLVEEHLFKNLEVLLSRL